MKIESDDLYGWIKKKVTYANIIPRMVTPRDVAVDTKEEEEEKSPPTHMSPCVYPTIGT